MPSHGFQSCHEAALTGPTDRGSLTLPAHMGAYGVRSCPMFLAPIRGTHSPGAAGATSIPRFAPTTSPSPCHTSPETGPAREHHAWESEVCHLSESRAPHAALAPREHCAGSR